MDNPSSETSRDLLIGWTRPGDVGSPLGAHTCHEPPATEGRVQAERSEPEGSLDADRAGGISAPVVSWRGDITPAPKTTGHDFIGQFEGVTRPVSGIQMDGGSSVWHRDLPEPSRLPPPAARLLAACLAAPKGGLVSLGLTRAAPGGGSETWGEVSYTQGQSGRNISIHVHGHVYLKWGVDRGELEMQIQAPVLWKHGAKTAIQFWCGQLHELFFGDELGISELYRNGWKMGRVDLCVDFVNFGIEYDDQHRMVGVRKNRARKQVEVLGVGGNGEVETIYFGTSESNCQVALYNKTIEVIANDKDPTVYQPTWIRKGWQGQDITRVELRIRGKGRWIKHIDDAQPVTYDFSDPFVAATMGHVAWQYWTMKKRLSVPDNDRATRRSTDPRWLAVQSVDYVEIEREMLRGGLIIDDEACERRDRLAWRGIQRLAAGIEARRHRTMSELRQGMHRTVADGMAGTFTGQTPEEVEHGYRQMFREACNVQSAELGEVIRLRADAADAALAREREPERIRPKLIIKRPPRT